MSGYNWFDYFLKTCAVLIIIALITMIVGILTYKCGEYEDLCYETICSKGCFHKPVSCSDNRVEGHEQFCTNHIYIWNARWWTGK